MLYQREKRTRIGLKKHSLSEEIKTENFPNFVKDINLQIQEAKQILNMKKPKEIQAKTDYN